MTRRVNIAQRGKKMVWLAAVTLQVALVCPWASAQIALPLFGEAVAVNNSAPVDTGDDTSPRLAGDGQGNLVAVWLSDDPAEGPGLDLDIFVSVSADGGAIWSDPAPLNSDAFDDSLDDAELEIATDGQGTYVVVWVKSGSGSSTTTDIRYAISDDGGVSWTDAAAVVTLVQDVNRNSSDSHPTVAGDGAGTWVVTWSSTRDVDGDETPGEGEDDPPVPIVTTDGDIFYASSEDITEGFSSAIALDSGNADDSASDTEPAVAADGAGNWMIVWNQGGQYNAFRSENGGAVWVSLGALPGASGDNLRLINDGAREATETTGWYAIWDREGVFVSRYLESNDNAEFEGGLEDDEVFDEWLEPIMVAASGSGATIANDPAGRLIAAWQDGDVLVALSGNVGRDWTAPSPVDTESDPAGTDSVAASVGPDDWVMVWSSSKVRGDAGGDADLFVSAFGFGVFQDCNANGVEDTADIAAGTSEDCNTNGIPDECTDLETDNDGDGIIDACDDTPFGDDGGDGGDDGDGQDGDGQDQGDGDGGGGGGGGGLNCAFGMLSAFPFMLLGLAAMKIARGRRR